MNRIQSKDHNIGMHRIIMFLCLLTMIKNTYLKTDIVGFHIFVTLCVIHKKTNFCCSQKSYFDQIFFSHYKKLIEFLYPIIQ